MELSRPCLRLPTPPPSLIMQPTATMATAAASTTSATVALTTTWDNATDRPTVSEGWRGRGGQGCQRSCPLALTPDLLTPQAEPGPVLDSYLLLMVVMALFVGGALAVLSGALLLCRRCWEAHRRLHRCAVPSPPPGELGQVTMRAPLRAGAGMQAYF